jgi:hypothetical protein
LLTASQRSVSLQSSCTSTCSRNGAECSLRPSLTCFISSHCIEQSSVSHSMERCTWIQHPTFAAESCLCGTLDTSEPGWCTYCPFCSVYGNTLGYPSCPGGMNTALPYDPLAYAQDWTTNQFNLPERHQGTFANTGYTTAAESPDAIVNFKPDLATWPFELPEDDVSTTPDLSHTAQTSYHDADLTVAHGTGWQNLHSETTSQSEVGSPTYMHTKSGTETSQINPKATVTERQNMASSRETGLMSFEISESCRLGKSTSATLEAEVRTPCVMSLCIHDSNSIEAADWRRNTLCLTSFDPLISLENYNSLW